VNVYAQLNATDGSANTYVIGAHYDSVSGCPGANDDATGVAMCSALPLLGELRCRTAAVLFVLFDQEENGLMGSDEFATMLADNQTAIIAAHTIDQMGWDEDGDRTIELERPDEGLFELYEAAVSSSGFVIPLTETQTGGTDHVSFRNHGFKAIGLTEEYVSGDTTPTITLLTTRTIR